MRSADHRRNRKPAPETGAGSAFHLTKSLGRLADLIRDRSARLAGVTAGSTGSAAAPRAGGRAAAVRAIRRRGIGVVVVSARLGPARSCSRRRARATVRPGRHVVLDTARTAELRGRVQMVRPASFGAHSLAERASAPGHAVHGRGIPVAVVARDRRSEITAMGRNDARATRGSRMDGVAHTPGVQARNCRDARGRRQDDQPARDHTRCEPTEAPCPRAHIGFPPGRLARADHRPVAFFRRSSEKVLLCAPPSPSRQT